MRKSVTNIYHIDDMRGLIRDVLKKEKVVTQDDLNQALSKYATKDDLISFKDAILHELQGIWDNQELITGYKDQIENHDIRKEHIEKTPSFRSSNLKIC